MIVYYNSNQDNELNNLKKLHVLQSSMAKIPINKRIIELTNALRSKTKFISNTQISRDGLLGALRRIEWAYEELEKVLMDYKGYDKRESLMLVFFQNSKAFIEILKKCFPKIGNKENNKKVFKEVNIIRNFFAHAYEKDLMENKTFVRLNINHHFNDGLYELEIFDFDTAEKRFGLFFSAEWFYEEIVRLLDILISEVKKT